MALWMLQHIWVRQRLELDPYCSYTTQSELAWIKDLNQDKTLGIGMEIFRDRQERVRCVPYPNSVAEEYGVRYGDELQIVNDLEVWTMDVPSLASHICGPRASSVVLKVQSEGAAPRWVTLPCTKLAPSKTVYCDVRKKRATIRIFRFGPNTPKELSACLHDLHGIQDVVIDLSGNTGGNLAAALECLQFFLPKGSIILREETKAGVQTRHARQDGRWLNLHLSLWQDRYTASAAELLLEIYPYMVNVRLGKRVCRRSLNLVMVASSY